MAAEDTAADQDLSRFGGFMDAVFAIAITLPIVQITPPKVALNGDLAAAYKALLPELIAYVLEFAVIDLFWNYSHFSSKLLRKTDHGFTLLTVLYLACVSLTPLPARPFVDHFKDPANMRIAVSIYGAVLSSPTVVWFARWWWGVSRGLYDSALEERYVRVLTIRYAATMGVALGGVALLVAGSIRIGIATVALAIFSLFFPPAEPVFQQLPG